MINIEHAVQYQFPSFIREEYPALISFMKAYYRYLDTTTNIDNAAPWNLDETLDYISQYRNTFIKEFGEPEYLNVRDFIYNNKQLFEAKGTDDAFKFYFRAYFNEEIDVRRPNVLMASGGGISGSYFIQVRKTGSTDIAEVNDVLSIYNGITEYRVYIERVENLETNLDRIYFQIPKGFEVAVNTPVRIEAKSNYFGLIELSPFKFNILNGGKFWQIGKVFYAGPFLCKVKTIGANGALSKIEILKFGHGSSNNDSYVVSPFPRKPIGAMFDYEKIGNVHNLTIKDPSIFVADTVNGSGVLASLNTLYVDPSYFAEDYIIGGSVLYVETLFDKPVYGLDEDYTFDDWMQSRAKIQIVFSNYSREKINFISDDSMLSNQNVCMQDNLFYQQFSYAIDSQVEYKKYAGAISKLHPAGLHFSSNRLMVTELSMDTEIL